MWFRRGHSLGKKVHAISSDFACQNSDSSSLYFLTGDERYYSLDYSINLISVETQKYETPKSAIFSKNDSLESSHSFLQWERRSYLRDIGKSYIIFPILRA